MTCQGFEVLINRSPRHMAVKKKTSSEKPLPEISPKSTKDQILSAYNEVVELLEEKQVQSPLEEKKKEEERVVIHKSSQSSLEGIVSHLATLKINLTKQIDTLSDNLLEEFHKLSNLQQAIAIEQKHLQELYQIKETAHSLSALMLVQKEETEKFELKMQETREQFSKEMEEKKALWEKKQTDLETSYAEAKEKLEKQRKREEDEYKYTLELTRRQDAQAYAAKQEALERTLEEKRQDFAQKEALIETRLTEIESLKEKVQKFPEELAQTKEITTQEVTERLEAQYNFKATLNEKESDGEKKLYLQKIASLEAKVKEQELFIAQLTQKANDATAQVQAIACKALEASSQRLSYPVYTGDKLQEVPLRPEKKVS